MVKLYYQYWN